MKVSRFFQTQPWLVPLLLALVFFLLTARGIAWGLPDGWNPDELSQQVLKALHGELIFDEDNFDYPSLPKHAMYGVGWLAQQLGHDDFGALWAMRLLSVILGAGLVALTFAVARRLGAGLAAATLASLFVLTSSELAQHARFAHNDIYIALFATLSAWICLGYARRGERGWFYAACFTVGLAASSKYNGGALLLVPLALFAMHSGRALWQEKLRTAETLALGLLAAFGGYALGTPRALLWLAFYFKRMPAALLRHAQYGRQPGSQPGALGQWETMAAALGPALFVLGLVGLVYALSRARGARLAGDLPAALPWLVLPLTVLALDLPILFSYNYPPRFFLPLLPLLAVLAALGLERLWGWLAGRNWRPAQAALALVLGLTLGFAALRTVSIGLLFDQDARRPAGEFIATLPAGRSIEYTYYPPHIERAQFSRAHNYPVFFIKVAGDALPTHRNYEFNTGQDGLDDRQTTYLVVDSFTYNRFQDDYICGLHPADCAFFRALLADETNYSLLAAFRYTLPAWLPQPPISFLNPEVRVYQRQP